jgi:uncharacterized membrane protein (DUF2068 family)
MEQLLCGHVLSANNKLNGDIRKAGAPWPVPIGLREHVKGTRLKSRLHRWGMSARYALKLKRMPATPIGSERASESYGHWSVRHENEHTGSAASIRDGLTMKPSSPWFLKLLAIYYLVQGALLVAMGVAGLILVDQNQLLVVKQWLRVIRLDPDNGFIYWLLTRILPVTNEMLEAFSVGSFVYGGLAFAQGGGLWFSKPWASYLSVVVVGSFIPWQLYSLLDEVTALKLISLCINIVIVWYLLVSVLRARGAKKTDPASRYP